MGRRPRAESAGPPALDGLLAAGVDGLIRPGRADTNASRVARLRTGRDRAGSGAAWKDGPERPRGLRRCVQGEFGAERSHGPRRGVRALVRYWGMVGSWRGGRKRFRSTSGSPLTGLRLIGSPSESRIWSPVSAVATPISSKKYIAGITERPGSFCGFPGRLPEAAFRPVSPVNFNRRRSPARLNCASCSAVGFGPRSSRTRSVGHRARPPISRSSSWSVDSVNSSSRPAASNWRRNFDGTGESSTRRDTSWVRVVNA